MDKIKVKNLFIYLVVFPVRIYQLIISPLILNNCRFSPTCSNYCIQSLKKFGLIKGIYLSFFRLIKCHPFGKSGYDPIKTKIELKLVPLKEIKKYRKANLYNNLPKKLATYKEDNYFNTKHFGLFCDGKLVSGLTLIEGLSDDLNLKTFQIRGMFTLKSEYNKGYGSTLIKSLLKYLKKRKIKMIWCNSRITALNFYKKNNFEETGSSFRIKLIGQHKKLVRYL